MKIEDISVGRKMGSPALKVLLFQKSEADPVADLYRKIRDAALFTENVPMGLRVAALELVKNELLRTMQSEIDELI